MKTKEIKQFTIKVLKKRAKELHLKKIKSKPTKRIAN